MVLRHLPSRNCFSIDSTRALCEGTRVHDHSVPQRVWRAAQVADRREKRNRRARACLVFLGHGAWQAQLRGEVERVVDGARGQQVVLLCHVPARVCAGHNRLEDPRMGTVQLSGIVTLANTVPPNPRNLRRPHPSHVRHGVPILGRQRLAVRQHLTASGHGVTCRDESEAQRRSQPEMSRGATAARARSKSAAACSDVLVFSKGYPVIKKGKAPTRILD